MESEVSGGFVAAFASSVGASVPAVRLLLSILLAYPFALFHRQFLYKKSPILQHLYFTAVGSYLGYFNFGDSLIHGYICILVHYLVITLFKPSVISTIFTFTFQMVYLLCVYYVTDTANLDASWTMPHCVLTLRLIGQAFDIYDSTRDPKDLSKEQKEVALTSTPKLWEISGHVFYPGGFMIGPQFPFKRYNDFINGHFTEKDTLPNSVGPGIRRLLLGLMYVGIYLVGTGMVNNKFMLSAKYLNLPFYMRLLVLGLYGKILLYKYVSVWIIAEGACILGGISFNGKDTQGNDLWNGCENINISVFEKSYKFSHMISSFNKCTNHWISQYVYKRLKFVGNRHVSQLAALVFLAVWHGLYSGYYMCFFMEFLIMNMERDLEVIFSRNIALQKWHNSTIGFWIDVVILKTLVAIFFGYCILSFGLLTFEKWFYAYKDLYFIGCLIFGLWPIYAPIVKAILNSDHKKTS